nr:hypothetical protein [Desulforamulus aquiferis]
MNLVLHRLGYTFRGTLVNNCHIGGSYEDMNIWVRFNGRELTYGNLKTLSR